MEAIKQRALVSKEMMDLNDPVIAITELTEAVENWRVNGPPDFVTRDPDYMRFVKNACRQISTEILTVMKETIKVLNQKIQEVGTICDPKDLANILGELGRQLNVLGKLDNENKMPESENELDAELRRLKAELNITDDSPTSGNA